MGKYQRFFKIIILFAITSFFLIPQIANAYDPRLDRGLWEWCYEDVPPDLLQVLKDNFPQYMIDNSEFKAGRGVTEPSYIWDYDFADLDGIGERNYLVVMYSNGFFTALKILEKEEGEVYNLVWTSPFDLGGLVDYIRFIDLNNDNKPEIIIHSHNFSGRYSAENILYWTGTEAKLIMPYSTTKKYIHTNFETYTEIDSVSNVSINGKQIDYLDLDRDGNLEVIIYSPFFDEEGDDVSTTYKIYKWEAEEGYIYKEELETDPIIDASVIIKPRKWNLEWLKEERKKDKEKDDDEKPEGSVQAYIGNIEEEHSIDEAQLDSIRMNEKLAPVGKVKIKKDKGKKDEKGEKFTGGYIVARFDKREVIKILPEPKKDALKKGDRVRVTVSGLLTNGQLFEGAFEIEIEGKPEKKEK